MKTAIPQLGTRVMVSDGTPPPPARFARKREAWELRNYEGVMVELQEGAASVQRGDLFCRYLKTVSYAVPLGRITWLEDEPSYYVERGLVSARRPKAEE